MSLRVEVKKPSKNKPQENNSWGLFFVIFAKINITKMEGRRTKLNFSQHELHVIKQEDLLVHHLRKPGTDMDNIKYINTNGVMVVTGDYGNWMFCREFHPSADGLVNC